MESTRSQIRVEDILLDPENPRYHESLLVSGKKRWSDQKLYSIIQSEDISDIYKSIKDFGVLDPIWVVPKNNKFIVIEGNRRVVTLKKLLEEKQKPPHNIKYDSITANIFPSDIPIAEIDKQRIVLQGGKKDWSPFNVSSVITKLIMVHKFKISKVARMFSQSGRYIEKELENYKYYIEYSNYRKKNKLKEFDYKYTYFQQAGEAIREKFFQTFKQRQIFYSLITELHGKQARINSVALRGGLYRFNQVCQYDKILTQYLKNPKMTVEEAIELIKENSVTAAYPWVKQIKRIERGFERLSVQDIQKLKKDKVFMEQLENIINHCQKILR